MSAPTALYRRYRPDSFADVIGQEHVTAPLMTALEKNRVNHAYLFSGPRGCGKTTSARILARCLNCAQGPTSHPCGECDSCTELARGGPGSLDVIEIDAASHGGVDDARDLRERATFAPIRDRYKIFIIDEAHMVTSAGFNALLKIVEEPPEHIKFIFATTEPDKVIGTIRSRTHHYPFRLVPPEPLMAYLARLCEQENVSVAPGVLSLVVRAGGGSVRDSLSVLDQLMAGAGAAGLDYDLAVDLLGYTHASLLDDVVEALAANDSATVFKSVDRVIQTGHDPRRFVEDLLERFRDLIIVHAMPESAHAILRGTPDELIARMQSQSAQLGAAELSRAADITNAAFNEMTGATSPRLHLELLGARLLLPGADSSVRGMATRLDQLERRLNYAAPPAVGNAPVAVSPTSSPESVSSQQSSTPNSAHAEPGTSGGGLAAVRAQLARAKAEAGAEVAARQAPAASGPESAAAVNSVPAPEATSQSAPQAAQGSQSARTWDDLPTPASTPDFSSTPDASPQPDSQHPAQQAAAPAQPATPQPAPSHPAPSQPATSQGAQPQASQPVASGNPGQAAPSHDSATTDPPAASNSPAANASGIEVIRRAWPEILGSLRGIRMASWVIVNQNVVPQTFDGRELRVGLPSDGLIGTFSNSGHLENLQRSIHEVLGIAVQILPVAGDAPKASSEPNPKVRTGNTAPVREAPAGNSTARQAQNTRETATGPEDTAASDATAAAEDTLASEAAAAPLDSWGLPAEAAAPSSSQTAPASTPTSTQPATARETASTEVPAAQEAATAAQPAAHTAEPAAAVPTAEAAARETPDYWDGPTEPSEPSDPWDEPGTDAYPASDPYQDQQSGPPASHSDQEAVPAAVAHTPPRVSPIAAWTTGWDVPASAPQTASPAATGPATPEAPKRSARLAEQIAQQASHGTPRQPPQDWGVSLGQTDRSNVADPGWGSITTAPDWAQPSDMAPAAASAAAAASTLSETTEAVPQAGDNPVTSPVEPSWHSPDSSTAASPATTSAAPTAEPAPAAERAPAPADASTASGAEHGTDSGQGFGSAAESPLGTSPNYPTPAQHTPVRHAPARDTQAQNTQAPHAPAQSANGQSLAPAAQSAPASDVPVGEAKLSMYQRMANGSAAQAARAHAPGSAVKTPFVEDVPSPDDVTIEESGVAGQAAVERILGGVLIEERPLN